MSDKTTTDRLPEVNPEQASTNFYWTFGKEEVFNLQTTIRGTLTPEQIEAHLATAIEAMKAVATRHGHAKPVGYQAPAKPSNGNGAQAQTEAVTLPAGVPVEAQTQGNGAIGADETLETVPAESMAATMNDGKIAWKIKGGRFTKFGVTIYPEALKSAGYAPDDLDPRQVYNLTGKNAVILVKDGKAKKVTRLV